MKTNYLLLVLLVICFTNRANATHNRAGEISYKQTGFLQISATIHTYTRAQGAAVDRDSLELCWGDGTCTWVMRANGPINPNTGFPQGELMENNVKFNEYTFIHTYSSPGEYILSMIDPNRNGGIININFPESGRYPFAITTRAFVSEFEVNSSPITTLPPIDNGYVGLTYYHSPNAYDPNGDSLRYELIRPLRDIGEPIPIYYYPDEVAPGPNNNMSFDEKTGLFTWDSPQIAGEYNITILIKEFRNNELIGEMVRDIQFLIKPSMGLDLQLPEFESPRTDIVINNNSSLEIEYKVNNNKPVRLFAYGEPFELSRPATFKTDTSYSTNGAVSGTLSWDLIPTYMRDAPYKVALKAETIDQLIYILIIEIQVDGLVSITQSQYLPAKITTYPNPGQESFKVELQESRLKQDGHLRLYDIQGRLLFEQLVNSGSTFWEVPATNLASGTYYLRLTSPGLMLEEKVVKQ